MKEAVEVRKEHFTGIKKRVIHKRIALLVIALIMFQVFFQLAKRGYISVPFSVINAIDIFVVSILALLAVNVLLRLTTHKVFDFLEHEVEIEQRIFIAKIYSMLLYMLAVAVVLWRAGVSLSNITLFLGLAVTGVAFAVRDVLLSVFAWMVLLAKKPFRLGDVIKVGEDTGKVIKLGTFFVALQPADDAATLIKIPTKTFFDKHIHNFGYNRLPYILRIPVKSIPSGGQLRKITSHLGSMLRGNSSISIKTEVDKDAWYLKVVLTMPFSTAEKSDMVFQEAHRLLSSNLKH